MRKDVIVPVAGIVLLVICCAGPFLLAGIALAVALAVTHAQPGLIVATLAIVALIAAGLVFRTRPSKPGTDLSGVRR